MKLTARITTLREYNVVLKYSSTVFIFENTVCNSIRNTFRYISCNYTTSRYSKSSFMKIIWNNFNVQTYNIINSFDMILQLDSILLHTAMESQQMDETWKRWNDVAKTMDDVDKRTSAWTKQVMTSAESHQITHRTQKRLTWGHSHGIWWILTDHQSSNGEHGGVKRDASLKYAFWEFWGNNKKDLSCIMYVSICTVLLMLM